MDFCRFKYVPEMLEEILFPAVGVTPVVPVTRRKRRRVDDEDVEMRDGMTREMRAVILETGKESYLLSPSEAEGEGGRVYDIALMLEGSEVVVEEDGPVEVAVVPAAVTATATAMAIHSPEPMGGGGVMGKVVPPSVPVPVPSLQVLQRGLGRGMMRVERGGVYVLDPEADGGEWVIQVRRWRWGARM